MLSVSFSKGQNVNESRKGLCKRYLNKPLCEQKFCLDVKNRAVASKLEAKIKELGGDIELFLVPEIKSLITDRQQNCNSYIKTSQPKTPQSAQNQYSDLPTRNENDRARPKTRVDAMLEKVREQSTVSTKDLLEEAKQRGISILSVEKAFTWLNSIDVSVKLSLEKKKSKVIDLKSPYLKFEAFDRKTRPVFQEIPNWPTFNLNGAIGEPAFLCHSPREHNMTRKTRANNSRAVSLQLQPGYCEACRVEYSYLDEHIKSNKHQSFIDDQRNFEELDNLISDGCGINSFLKVNGISLAKRTEKSKSLTLSLKNSSCKSNVSKKMPKTRTSSACDKPRRSPMSPASSDSGHNLRTRKQNSLLVNSLSLNSEEEMVTAKVRRELRSSTRSSAMTPKVNFQDNDTWTSGRPKRSCIKQKRISADERLVFDNKTYYKVEVLTNKLRSSSIPIKEPEIPKVQTPVTEETQEDKGLIVKFRRMRYSELARLNDEAENFLFPRKDESSSEGDVDEDGPNTTHSTKKDESSILLSSEPDTKNNTKVKSEEDHSMDSSCSDKSGSRKKRRRTQAEAFIADNQKYYKFEMPGSRLRYQGSYLPPLPPKHNGECVATNETKKPEVKEEVQEPKLNLNEMKLSFEMVPKSEPWYQTFQRQDKGEEYYYSCFSDSGYWKPFILPYEIGPLPPVDPRICIWAYKQSSNYKEEANLSSSCSSKQTQFRSETSRDKSSESSTKSEPPLETKSNNLKKLGRRRKGILLPSRNPRKSPRQHASTLAILSSLIHQRKRRERKQSRSPDSGSLSAPSLSEGKRSSSKTLSEIELEQDYDSIAKTIDEVLSAPLDNMDKIDIDVQEAEDVNLKFDLHAVDMLEDYVNVKSKSSPPKSLEIIEWPIKSTVGRKPGRKKKKNRTGWPNKNKRSYVRKGDKEENDMSEHDSVADSPSIHIDSEDQEDDIDEDKKQGDSNHKTDNGTSVTDVRGTVKSSSNCRLNATEQKSISVNNNDRNGDKQGIMVNGISDGHAEAQTVVTIGKQKRIDAERREQRKSSSDTCAELVIASVVDKIECVNVDLEKWESAEKVLTARLSNSELITADRQLQPIVRVEKLDSDEVALKRERQSSLSPRRMNKKPRRMPASPKSPRILRKPRGRWYRDRF